jgi:hypothetical protein
MEQLEARVSLHWAQPSNTIVLCAAIVLVVPIIGLDDVPCVISSLVKNVKATKKFKKKRIGRFPTRISTKMSSPRDSWRDSIVCGLVDNLSALDSNREDQKDFIGKRHEPLCDFTGAILKGAVCITDQPR